MQGWDQSELAQRLGGKVRQQAVSGWERGISRPLPEMVSHLADILNVDINELMIASGYKTHTVGVPEEIDPPVRPRPTALPLANLHPDQFEQFSADLVGYLFPQNQVHRWGSAGHEQDGIDIIVQDGQVNIATFQCKRHKQFGPAKVAEAVGKVRINAAQHFILLSRGASPAARKEVKKHDRWDIWDVQDISFKVRGLYTKDPESAVNLIDTYFENWLEAFLGVSEPGPWITSQVFFRRFEGDRIFSHNWKLVGRQGVLEEIKTFFASDSEPVAIISGIGGSGKTRLLREVSLIAEKELAYQVRFLALGSQDLTLKSYKLLPNDARLLLIIDDAHERTDISEIISGVNRVRPKAKFLLGMRPYGFSQLADDLKRVALYPSEIKTWQLHDLKISEVEELAWNIVGKKGNQADISRIASLTRDCPFITVVASGLLKRGKLNPTTLEGNDSIRNILRDYRNEVIESSRGDFNVVNSLINAIALIQPINIASEAFTVSLASICSRPFDELMPYIRKFEDSGILMRRGRSFRIVPDLLGDVILSEACFDDRSGVGQSIGYIERVHKKLNGLPLQHLVINLSRVDWQVNSQQETNNSILDRLWLDIEKEFKGSDIRARRQIIQLVQKIAYFQPEKAIALAKWAIDNPTSDVKESKDIFAQINPPDYQDVLNEVPTLLRRVAYNVDYLLDAANVLWELAKGDTRKPNQYPDHPIRVLQDLASYQIGKPVGFNNIMIDVCERWLKDGQDAVSIYSPFDVLDCLLATEGSDDFSEGFTISFRPYSINLSVVRQLRDRVNELAFQQVESKNIRNATRAILSIGEGLKYPNGLFGRAIKDKERDAWTPIFVATINKLASIVNDKKLEPVINLTIRNILDWHTHCSQTETKDAAVKLLGVSQNIPDLEVAIALYDGWGRQFDRIKDRSKAELRKQAWFDRVAKKVSTKKTDKEVVDLIERRLDKQILVYEDRGYPGPFVWTLTKIRPSIGEMICQCIIENPQSSLTSVLPVTLSQLVGTKPKEALVIANKLIKKGDVTLIRSVAQALGWNRGLRTNLVEGETDLLNSLATHEDEYVRTSVIRAAEVIAKENQEAAINLLAKVRFDNSHVVAKEYFSVFGSHGVIKWKVLSKDHRKNIWRQLLICPSIEDYHITEFLAEASTHDPKTVLKLLKDRVEIDEKHHDRSEFRALPYHWDHLLQVNIQPHYDQLLREIINWIAKNPNSWQRLKMGAEIFKTAAGGFDQVVVEVLDKAICSGSREQVQAAAATLREAPRNFVWEQVDFVKKILREASDYDEKTLQRVSSSLYASVISGARSGKPGQPFREDIEQRDRSLEVAESLIPGSVEAKFYRSLEKSARESIRSHAEHDEKLLDGREW